MDPLDVHMSWILRHAAFTITRFRVLPNGRSSYYLLKSRHYSGELVEYGELVWYRDPRAVLDSTKMESRWAKAIWVGKIEASDEHVVIDGPDII